eukprot:jgi/Hompol1/3396/HPOL_003220-RA
MSPSTSDAKSIKKTKEASAPAAVTGTGAAALSSNGSSNGHGNGSTATRAKRILAMSKVAARTFNPIRKFVEQSKAVPNPHKKKLALSIGDPTLFGNFKLDQSCMDAVKRKLEDYSANGYTPATGTDAARKAIAEKYTRPEAPLVYQDVILASGCSDSLNLCIGALCDEGQNILIPAPGFSLYETLASSKGIECRFYHLVPERQWEADLAEMESLIDDNTAAIIVNNPSNPCGSVYSKKHLQDILAIAERYGLPIIADEIYGDMVFKGHEFFPMATLTTTVPILAAGGLAKRYLVPGWRLGWILIHDRDGQFEEIRKGIVNLSQLTLGANSLVQAAVPEILQAPESFYEETMKQLESNANISREMLKGIPGLTPIFPQGAMYLLLQIKIEEFEGIKNDFEFAEKLIEEEAVFVLAGQIFRCPGEFLRIVFTAPVEQLREAYERIRQFCIRHHTPTAAKAAASAVSVMSPNKK